MTVVSLAEQDRARKWVAKLDSSQWLSQCQFPLVLQSTKASMLPTFNCVCVCFLGCVCGVLEVIMPASNRNAQRLCQAYFPVCI